MADQEWWNYPLQNRTAFNDRDNNMSNTPMRKLIRKMPGSLFTIIHDSTAKFILLTSTVSSRVARSENWVSSFTSFAL